MFKSIMKFRLFTQFISAGSSPGIRHSFGGIYRVVAAKVEDGFCLMTATLNSWRLFFILSRNQPWSTSFNPAHKKTLMAYGRSLYCALKARHRSSIFPPRINTTSIWRLSPSYCLFCIEFPCHLCIADDVKRTG